LKRADRVVLGETGWFFGKKSLIRTGNHPVEVAGRRHTSESREEGKKEAFANPVFPFPESPLGEAFENF
jgi:hypothetical protein